LDEYVRRDAEHRTPEARAPPIQLHRSAKTFEAF